MKTFENFLINYGFTIPLGTVAFSYWETIDHVIRTAGLVVGFFTGIVILILQLKKLFGK